MASIADRVTPRLSLPSLEQREKIAAGPSDAESHARWFEELECLHEVEVTPPSGARTAASSIRVVAWNTERGRHVASLARVLLAESPDVVLLSEMDVGMARSGNLHTAGELARRIGMGCVYGVEFVELGLGGPAETRAHAGEVNTHGLHGGAILCAAPLERPAVLRLESEGHWFDASRNEPRVGGRIAVLATVRLGDAPMTVAAVHLESHSETAMRLDQITTLLDAVERYAPGQPALVAGDLNSFSFGLEDTMTPGRIRDLMDEDPNRLIHPVPHEPLFEAARERGFSWEDCNVMRVPTQRIQAEGSSSRGGLKIDWFLSRGLVCSSPAILEAVLPETGTALSDHEPIAVTCAL